VRRMSRLNKLWFFRFCAIGSGFFKA